MKAKVVRGVEVKSKDVELLEEKLKQFLFKEIYLPLLSDIPALDDKKLLNAKSDVKRALAEGRIAFYRGKFSGKFTAAVSKQLRDLGASFDRASSTWNIQLNSLPEDIQESIRISETAFNRVGTKVLGTLEGFNSSEIAKKISFEKLFDSSILDLENKFQRQIAGLGYKGARKSQLKDLMVAPDLTAGARKILAKNYSNNLKLYVKNFIDDEIIRLRETMTSNFYKGNRYEGMIRELQNSFGITASKAKFLAKQETKLLQSNYRQARYQDAGSEGYTWRCVKGTPKHPVRPEHKALDGKYIRWSEPPIVDSKTGRRAHAGADFNCRCDCVVEIRF